MLAWQPQGAPRLSPRTRRVSRMLMLLALLCLPLAGCVNYEKSPVAGLYVENWWTPHPSMLLLLPDGTYYHYFYRPSQRTYGDMHGTWRHDRSDKRYTFTNMGFYPADNEGPSGGPPGEGGYWCPHLYRDSVGRAEFRPNINYPDRYFVWQVGVSGARRITESLASPGGPDQGAVR